MGQAVGEHATTLMLLLNTALAKKKITRKAFKNIKILRKQNVLERRESSQCGWEETFPCEQNQLIGKMTVTS